MGPQRRGLGAPRDTRRLTGPVNARGQRASRSVQASGASQGPGRTEKCGAVWRSSRGGRELQFSSRTTARPPCDNAASRSGREGARGARGFLLPKGRDLKNKTLRAQRLSGACEQRAPRARTRPLRQNHLQSNQEVHLPPKLFPGYGRRTRGNRDDISRCSCFRMTLRPCQQPRMCVWGVCVEVNRGHMAGGEKRSQDWIVSVGTYIFI